MVEVKLVASTTAPDALWVPDLNLRPTEQLQ